jgi:hypothetical protein
VAAITLGLVGHANLAERLGRNAAYDRAGNIFIGGLAGLVGWLFGQRAVFHLVPLFAVLTALTVLAIPARAIDHQRARGLDDRAEAVEDPAGWHVLLDRGPLLARSSMPRSPTLPDVRKRDAGTLLGERAGRIEFHSGAGSGDQGHLSCEIIGRIRCCPAQEVLLAARCIARR